MFTKPLPVDGHNPNNLRNAALAAEMNNFVVLLAFVVNHLHEWVQAPRVLHTLVQRLDWFGLPRVLCRLLLRKMAEHLPCPPSEA
ncbi:MAG: hypothetical protein C7B45_05250 [Sulfobacillus acidophilus]|uniref:Uncharacterized protein n=1 Tax=Sulfobacillus acidophilus TaxID=53633 RepID=A0A2T2WKU8_9FIRM|nr:MAG: hypothetical protein C7B45_05250 [Sulfobacillus acidophilus]